MTKHVDFITKSRSPSSDCLQIAIAKEITVNITMVINTMDMLVAKVIDYNDRKNEKMRRTMNW